MGNCFDRENHVYVIKAKEGIVQYGFLPVFGAHLDTFSSLGDGYAKDHLFVYYRGKRINGAHAPSFFVDYHGNGFDRVGFYRKGKRQPNKELTQSLFF